jgi:predicted DsbA family dithiol-disulfide isomerase
MNVEMVLDIPCVWSSFGFTRLRRAADRLRAEGGQVRMHFSPFQLAPGATAEGELKTVVMRRTFGDGVQDAISGITRYAAENGLEFRHERAIFSNTFEAHRLIAVASAQGRGEEMVERLFRAHHTDELNVADEATLRTLAAEVGVVWTDAGAEQVRAELARVRAEGVRSIPVFRFGNHVVLSGNREQEALYEALAGHHVS